MVDRCLVFANRHVGAGKPVLSQHSLERIVFNPDVGGVCRFTNRVLPPTQTSIGESEKRTRLELQYIGSEAGRIVGDCRKIGL